MVARSVGAPSASASAGAGAGAGHRYVTWHMPQPFPCTVD